MGVSQKYDQEEPNPLIDNGSRLIPTPEFIHFFFLELGLVKQLYRADVTVRG